MAKTGLIILAAGSSSRMGVPKQLLDFGGKALVRHAAEQALASVCSPVTVVLGASAELVRDALAGLPLRFVFNPEWREGMGTSIRAGLLDLAGQHVDGVILALGDQPLISSRIFDRLVDIHGVSGLPIVASHYADTVGVPVFFARSHFPQLLALEPAQGCKGVILKNRDEAFLFECPEAEADVDTPADYERLRPVV